MRKVNKFLVVPLLFFISCGNKEQLHPRQFMEHIEKSDALIREIESGDLVYKFQYKPSAYIACKELSEKLHDTLSVHKRIADLKKTVWFNVSIRSKQKGEDPLRMKVSGQEEYNYRLAYFLTDASSKFSLTYGNEGQMRQAGYVFENNYGLTPMDVMVVGFYIPDDHPVKDMVLEYNDELFNNALLRAKITTTDIQKIPQLSFN